MTVSRLESSPTETRREGTRVVEVLPVPTRPPTLDTVAGMVDGLLRHRELLRARASDGGLSAKHMRALLLVALGGSAIFGGVVGLYRGGPQIAFAAIKFPLVLLLSAAVCIPVLTCVNAALDRPASLRNDCTTIALALAHVSLVLVAEVPLLAAGQSIAMEYHAFVLLLVGCCIFAGAVGLRELAIGIRGQSETANLFATGVVFISMAIVGAQMAWSLRPYVVRPRSPEVPFVRNMEGSLLQAISTSYRSARGVYSRDHAPLPDEETLQDGRIEVRP